MDSLTALHTAARRYCMDRSEHWRRQYLAYQYRGHVATHAGGVGSEPEAISPCYIVLDAILNEVEGIVPTESATFEALQELLILAGHTAENLFTRPPHSAIAEAAMAEERGHFAASIRQRTPYDVSSIVPLPYRRALPPAEREHLWLTVGRRWGIEGGYWHPLIRAEIPLDVLAFQAAWFAHALPLAQLREILVRQGVKRLWELREFGPEPDFELDVALFAPVYNGAEGYWTSSRLDWLIYASHESSITIAGDWLIAEVKAHWTEWEAHLYTGWEYPRPYGW